MTGAEVCASLIERPLLDRSGWPSLPRVRRLLMQAFFRGVRPPTVDRWTDGAEDVGGIQVVPTPGHTPGHIALLWEGWLLAGDAFRTGQRFRESIWPFTIDQAASRQTIEGLLALAPQAASSSHGRPAHAATERLQTLVATWR
jgi:glyoxylase-like metal-dependent hydrolase (beta-lactamase superfamily II)